jgi:hypothetical protein
MQDGRLRELRVMPCDCGLPMTRDPMVDRFRCPRRVCHHRIDAEAVHAFAYLLARPSL